MKRESKKTTYVPISSMKLWWRIFKHTFKWWYLLVFTVIAMIVYTVCDVAMIYMVRPVLGSLFDPNAATITSQLSQYSGLASISDRIWTSIVPVLYGNSFYATLQRLILVLLVIVFLNTTFHYIQTIAALQLLQNVTNDIRKKLFAKIISMPLGFFHKTKSGELISRVISDVQMMQESIGVTIADLIREPLKLCGYYFIMMTIDYKMTLSVTLVVPVIIFFMSVIGKILRRYGARTQAKMAQVSSVLQEGLTAIRVVKGFNAESYENKKFSKFANSYLRNIMKMFRVRRLAMPFNEILGGIIAAVLLWYGGIKVYAGIGLNAEQFFQYLTYLFMMIQPIKSFSSKVTRVQEGLGAAERVYWLLDLKWRTAPPIGHLMVSDIKKEISFEDVSFKYDGSEDYALKNFSIRIPAGNVVALVGYSGAGKSTTADLLARFYIPQDGSVRVDGNDLKDINEDSWRSILGIVSQEVILFNDTITANISYGDDNPDIKRVYDAAKAAYALDFIEKMPDGFNTEVGDRGIRLSGGERQRVAIARAIYRNPRVLILDEATSSLDSHSERLVQNAIDNLVQGRTVLVIAHRLSTVQRSDSIIVIDKGKKICEGTHNELLNICPKYRELYEMQFDFGSNTS